MIFNNFLIFLFIFSFLLKMVKEDRKFFFFLIIFPIIGSCIVEIEEGTRFFCNIWFNSSTMNINKYILNRIILLFIPFFKYKLDPMNLILSILIYISILEKKDNLSYLNTYFYISFLYNGVITYNFFFLKYEILISRFLCTNLLNNLI